MKPRVATALRIQGCCGLWFMMVCEGQGQEVSGQNPATRFAETKPLYSQMM